MDARGHLYWQKDAIVQEYTRLVSASHPCPTPPCGWPCEVDGPVTGPPPDLDLP